MRLPRCSDTTRSAPPPSPRPAWSWDEATRVDRPTALRVQPCAAETEEERVSQLSLFQEAPSGETILNYLCNTLFESEIFSSEKRVMISLEKKD